MTVMRVRKLALATLVAALVGGCGENPAGPGTVTKTASTSTSISTTTTTAPPKTTASFVFAPTTPAALEEVSFNALGSSAAPGRTLVGYSWDFGDGQSKTGLSVTHDFFPRGVYIVTLTVTDSAGEKASTTQPLGVGTPLPSTTTTSIPTTTAERYLNPSASPDVPSDLTLYFRTVLVTPIEAPSASARFERQTRGNFSFAALGDSRFAVLGTYGTRSGRTGTIDGELVGTITPRPSGTFTGTLTADIAGCVAVRAYSGPLVNDLLQWTGGSIVTNTCGSNNPLTFDNVNLQKTDLPPSPPPTTSVVCNYSLNPVSLTVGSAGGSGSVALGTAAGCGWTVQTSTPWITLNGAASGTGPATITFTIAPFPSAETQNRTGSIVIAGITFLVVQNAPGVTTTTTTSTIPTTSTISTTTTIPTTSTISTTSTVSTTSTIPTTSTTTSTFSTTTTIPVTIPTTPGFRR